MYKKVMIADEEGNPQGSEEYLAAIEQGLLRMVSRVFVFDTEGRLLLQKRSKNVRHPSLWDQSVGGHVDEGESYRGAAVREMAEEIGITGVPLVEVMPPYRTDVYNGIYKAVVSSGTPIMFDEEEIEEVRWMTPDALDASIKESPDEYTKGFVHAWIALRAKLVA